MMENAKRVKIAGNGIICFYVNIHIFILKRLFSRIFSISKDETLLKNMLSKHMT